MSSGTRAGLRISRPSRPRIGGVIAMAFAVAFCAWLLVDRGHGASRAAVRIEPSAATGSAAPAPGSLTASALEKRARSLGQPVYWAGAQTARRYLLDRDDRGDVIVNYVAAAGSEQPMLTVATIPYRGAFAATQQLAGKPGAVSRRLADGGIVYYRPDRPSSYLAYPRIDYLVEVNAPSPSVARELLLDGRIQPIG